MGVRILEGEYDGGYSCAVLVCSTTETAFGPLFRDSSQAEAFVNWFERTRRMTVRSASQEGLALGYSEFCKVAHECPCGNWTLNGGDCDECEAYCVAGSD